MRNVCIRILFILLFFFQNATGCHVTHPRKQPSYKYSFSENWLQKSPEISSQESFVLADSLSNEATPFAKDSQ